MFLYLSQGPIFVAFFQSYLYFSDLIRLRACTRAHWTFIISVVHIGCFLFRTICHSRCFVWKFCCRCTATHTHTPQSACRQFRVYFHQTHEMCNPLWSGANKHTCQHAICLLRNTQCRYLNHVNCVYIIMSYFAIENAECVVVTGTERSQFFNKYQNPICCVFVTRSMRKSTQIVYSNRKLYLTRFDARTTKTGPLNAKNAERSIIPAEMFVICAKSYIAVEWLTHVEHTKITHKFTRITNPKQRLNHKME